MKEVDEKPKSFEASLEALEEIVHQLEGGDLPLEKSLELFEQGIGLSRQCQERLSQAERRIGFGISPLSVAIWTIGRPWLRRTL